jgi:hypothetical protein
MSLFTPDPLHNGILDACRERKSHGPSTQQLVQADIAVAKLIFWW